MTYKVKRYLVKTLSFINATFRNALKLFLARKIPGPRWGSQDAPPDPVVSWGLPSPTTPMASRLGASILGAFGASAKVLLFVESKKSLYYTTQHCSQPFGPYVQTDISVTGLMVQGPRVSICPRAPSRSVTPLSS